MVEIITHWWVLSIIVSLVTNCVWLCDSMERSMPGFPVLHCLPWVCCSSSCTLSWWCHPTISSSVTLFSCPQFFQHHGLFHWVSSSHQVAKYWSFSFSIRPYREYSDWFPLGLTGMISLLSKGLSRVFCSTTIQMHQFVSTQPSLWSNSHICTWLL